MQATPTARIATGVASTSQYLLVMFHVKHHLHYLPRGSLAGIPAFLGYFFAVFSHFLMTTKDRPASSPASIKG